jgi:hypothetical protein
MCFGLQKNVVKSVNPKPLGGTNTSRYTTKKNLSRVVREFQKKQRPHWRWNGQRPPRQPPVPSRERLLGLRLPHGPLYNLLHSTLYERRKKKGGNIANPYHFGISGISSGSLSTIMLAMKGGEATGTSMGRVHLALLLWRTDMCSAEVSGSIPEADGRVVVVAAPPLRKAFINTPLPPPPINPTPPPREDVDSVAAAAACANARGAAAARPKTLRSIVLLGSSHSPYIKRLCCAQTDVHPQPRPKSGPPTQTLVVPAAHTFSKSFFFFPALARTPKKKQQQRQHCKSEKQKHSGERPLIASRTSFLRGCVWSRACVGGVGV